MSEIVKRCKAHGDLTVENVRLQKVNKNGKPSYVCRLCLRIASKKYYWANKDKLNKKRYSQPSSKSKKTIERKKQYRKENKEKFMEYKREYDRNARESLSDNYIKYCLSKSSRSLKFKDFGEMKGLIALKRAVIAIKRELNNNEQH